MRALTVGKGGVVELTQRPKPELFRPTDAIVELEMTGICGTDLHAVQGHLPGVPVGTVLGHEFVGRVASVGASVTSIRVGQRVVSSNFSACGHCWFCRRGQHWHCPERAFFGTGTSFGPELAGGQSDVVRVPFADTTLAELPDEIASELGVLMSDNLATGYVAAERGEIGPGDVVAVIGGGMVGQLAALMAQLRGASAVVVSDPVENRRRAAELSGNASVEPHALLDGLQNLTDGRGADVVVEAAGGARGLDAALAACRSGGKVVSVSAHADPTYAFPLADAFAREISLTFAIGNSIGVRDRLIALAGSGLLAPAAAMVTTRSLSAGPQAYSEVGHMEAMKIALAV